MKTHALTRMAKTGPSRLEGKFKEFINLWKSITQIDNLCQSLNQTVKTDRMEITRR